MLRESSIAKKIKQDISLYLMILVPVLFILVFSYIPMLGIMISFRKFRLSEGFINSLFFGEWVGLKYYIRFVNDPVFWRILKNTVLLSFYSLVYGFPAPIILALLLNELRNEKFKRITQTISYLPHFVSVVIIVGIMMQILSPTDGIVNRILNVFGMDTIFFMVKPEWFRTLYISSGIWQGIGWGSIIYIASITGMDPQLFEAAEIDGAGRFRRIIHVTIPGILPIIIIILLLRIGDILSVGFEKVLLMQGDSTMTYLTSDVIDTHVYRTGIRLNEYSYGTAIGVFKAVIGMVLLTFANRTSRKFTETSLW